jgi:hypothetical protein
VQSLGVLCALELYFALEYNTGRPVLRVGAVRRNIVIALYHQSHAVQYTIFMGRTDNNYLGNVEYVAVASRNSSVLIPSISTILHLSATFA